MKVDVAALESEGEGVGNPYEPIKEWFYCSECEEWENVALVFFGMKENAD